MAVNTLRDLTPELYLEIDPRQSWQPARWHVVIGDSSRPHLAYLGADGTSLSSAPIQDALATLARGDTPCLTPVPLRSATLVGAVVGVRVLDERAVP